MYTPVESGQDLQAKRIRSLMQARVASFIRDAFPAWTDHDEHHSTRRRCLLNRPQPIRSGRDTELIHEHTGITEFRDEPFMQTSSVRFRVRSSVAHHDFGVDAWHCDARAVAASHAIGMSSAPIPNIGPFEEFPKRWDFVLNVHHVCPHVPVIVTLEMNLRRSRICRNRADQISVINSIAGMFVPLAQNVPAIFPTLTLNSEYA